MRVTDHYTLDVTSKFDAHDHGLFGGCLFCNERVSVQEDFEVVQSHGQVHLAHCACIDEAKEKPK